MKDNYEKLLIEIEFISKDDVITTSSLVDDEHDNDYSNWDEL